MPAHVHRTTLKWGNLARNETARTSVTMLRHNNSSLVKSKQWDLKAACVIDHVQSAHHDDTAYSLVCGLDKTS